ncbi:hypothetical protein OTSSIDO_0511 [Orientia tsutsugamushi str. Sido]|nr:hypothetical protein OTSSIDO_0511 [Orientia tsutsugamushi str. Sido]
MCSKKTAIAKTIKSYIINIMENGNKIYKISGLIFKVYNKISDDRYLLKEMKLHKYILLLCKLLEL